MSEHALREQIKALEYKIEQRNMLLVNIEDTCRVHLNLPYGAVPDCTDNAAALDMEYAIRRGVKGLGPFACYKEAARRLRTLKTLEEK